jgi:hypothetical protein
MLVFINHESSQMVLTFAKGNSFLINHMVLECTSFTIAFQPNIIKSDDICCIESNHIAGCQLYMIVRLKNKNLRLTTFTFRDIINSVHDPTLKQY